MPDTNGWNEWGRHVLAELERLNDCEEKAAQQRAKILADIAVLKTKAALWGGGAGLVPAVILFALKVAGVW